MDFNGASAKPGKPVGSFFQDSSKKDHSLDTGGRDQKSGLRLYFENRIC